MSGDERFTEVDRARFDFPVVCHVVPVYDDLTPLEAFALLGEHGCTNDPHASAPPLAARRDSGIGISWCVAVANADTGELVGFVGDDGNLVAPEDA
jgi:hypothetical protein